MSSLLRAASDMATLIELIGSAPDSALGSPDALRQQLLTQLRDFERSAERIAKVDAADIAEARFALVAWADDAVARSQWYARGHWSPLQREVLDTLNAGKEFFEHLDGLKPDSPAREVYFLALALGFEGQLALERSLANNDARARLVEREYQQLRRSGRAVEITRERELTPTAYRLSIHREVRRGGGMLRYLLVILLAGLVTYGVLWALLEVFAGDFPVAGGG